MLSRSFDLQYFNVVLLMIVIDDHYLRLNFYVDIVNRQCLEDAADVVTLQKLALFRSST